ncbi:MAG: hypothetical protein KBS99_02345 [Prevotellaceae bacterium]|nr:hypothetical protein [Candidatus Colivivens caballi]
MRKSYFLAAAAVVAMVGCTNEDYFGANESLKSGEAAINFGTGAKKITRADNIGGEAAATALNNNFVVYGFKSKDAATATTFSEQIAVFDHYSVNYKTGTAGSTESNSKNWEYVGQEMSGLQKEAQAQTIKYWDFAKKQYDFVAFSKGTNTAAYEDLFSQVDASKLGTTNAAYTVKGTVAELQNCYVADLLTVESNNYASTVVTPVFRKMASKVRLGIYETIPGYSVKNVKFYTAKTAAADMTDATKVEKATLFSSSAIFPKSDAKGVMKVSFPTIGDATPTEAKNKAFIEFTADDASAAVTTMDFDKLNYEASAEQYEADAKYLGRTSATATYAKGTETGNYISVLPKNTQDVVTLQVDYTLVAIDGSKEEITVHGATAEVPAIYTEWQPNYAYTYLFKISDQTNGLTNPDDFGDDKYAGLFPITFDAMVMNDENGIQETITEVGKPSITTYQHGKVVTENDEYKTGDEVYVVVNDESLKTLSTTNLGKVGAVQLFTAETSSSAIQGITEESVANCIDNNFDPTFDAASYVNTDIKTGTLTLTPSNLLSVVDEIPSTDAPHGVAIEKAGMIGSFKPTAAGTYVFQYMTKETDFGTPTANTLKKGAIYYTIAKNTVGNKTTYAPATGTAVGNEIVAADNKLYVKTLPTWSTTLTSAPATLKTGATYYKFTGDNFEEYKANGTETSAAGTFKEGSLTKVTAGTDLSTLTDGYYVKSGKNYTMVATGTGVAGAADEFYTIESLIAAKFDYLAAGTTYFYKESSNYIELKANGDEKSEDYTLYDISEFIPVYYTTDECTTLNSDVKYYTIDSTTGVATLVENDGSQTLQTTYKTVTTPAKYAYKVIRVQ